MTLQQFPPQATGSAGQLLAQVIERLGTGLTQDRRQRVVATLLWATAAGAAGWAAGRLWHSFDPAQAMTPWGPAALGAMIAAAVAATLQWRHAPDLLTIARRADRATGLDRAVETAVEGALKGRAPTDLTGLLHDRVTSATQSLTTKDLAPWHIGRPVAALVLGAALALGAQFVPVQPINTTISAAEMTRLQDGLAAIAALRDSADPALAALAREAEALAATLATADEADRAMIAAALADLQEQAARILGTDPDDDTIAALERLAASLADKAAEVAPEDETPADYQPTAPSIEEVKQETIDAPENTMNATGEGAEYEAIQNDNMECQFGDAATCQIEDGGVEAPANEPADDDLPEQIRADELTEGGDISDLTSTGTGDAGATGTAQSALYGTAELLPVPESQFIADSLMLGADNPLGEGQRTEIDIPTTFDMTTPAGNFPDAPRIGQDNWRRAPEAPVARMTADPALNRALNDYYRAPEDWR